MIQIDNSFSSTNQYYSPQSNGHKKLTTILIIILILLCTAVAIFAGFRNSIFPKPNNTSNIFPNTYYSDSMGISFKYDHGFKILYDSEKEVTITKTNSSDELLFLIDVAYDVPDDFYELVSGQFSILKESTIKISGITGKTAVFDLSSAEDSNSSGIEKIIFLKYNNHNYGIALIADDMDGLDTLTKMIKTLEFNK